MPPLLVENGFVQADSFSVAICERVGACWGG